MAQTERHGVKESSLKDPSTYIWEAQLSENGGNKQTSLRTITYNQDIFHNSYSIKALTSTYFPTYSKDLNSRPPTIYSRLQRPT